jgi:multiple sugar transport system substrate-binding protein
VQVYGLVMNFDDPATPIDWVRGFGGDFISPDYKVVVDQPGAVKAVSVLCDLYKKGVLPKNSMSLKTEDVITFMQQGRGAMTNNPFNRYINYNDAKASKYAGKIAVVSLPTAVDGKPMAAKTSVWAMAIPRNSRNKERAWSLIRHLSLRESTVAATLNGNGPVRPSAYEDPKVTALIPYAAAEKQALASAKLVVPGFPNAAKSMDIFIEELGYAMLGQKEPQAAMAEVRKRVQPLLPA